MRKIKSGNAQANLPYSSCCICIDANKKVIFKNYAPFTSSIREINNTQAHDAQDIVTLMLIYNLI